MKTWVDTTKEVERQSEGEMTVPTLEVPGEYLPVQGLPSGMSFKIILKNAKIKAEKMIIKAEKR